MIGEVAHLDDCRNLLRHHGAHTFQHGLLAHRATVATAAHGEVRSSLFVVAGKRYEPAVRGKHWVYFGSNDCFDLG